MYRSWGATLPEQKKCRMSGDPRSDWITLVGADEMLREFNKHLQSPFKPLCGFYASQRTVV